MGVLQKIEAELKEAMKAKAMFRLGVLRLMKTAVKNKEIDLKHALTDEEFFTTLTTMIKQRHESVTQYEKAGRADLAESESKEITVIQEFLPRALSEDELHSLIQAAIKTSGAAGPKDMGKVMGALKPKTAGRVDGKILADKVRAALQ